jgi:hypothetical protein
MSSIVSHRQWAQLAGARQQQEVERLCSHVADFAPRHAEVIGRQQVRETVQLGLQRAALVGFDLEGPVLLYLDLMLLFGSGFASDPQLAFTRPWLDDPDAATQMQRAEGLHAACLAYLQQAAGEGHAYTLAALVRLAPWSLAALPFGPQQWPDAMIDLMAHLYPQKAQVLGRPGLAGLAALAAGRSTELGLGSFEGAVLTAVLMFALGHEFARDPLYPWVRTVLADDRAPGVDDRVRRLEGHARAYLRRVLAHFQQTGALAAAVRAAAVGQAPASAAVSAGGRPRQ